MNYKTAICDDSSTDRDYIRNLVQDWAATMQHNVQINTFASAESFLFHYAEHKDYDFFYWILKWAVWTVFCLQRSSGRRMKPYRSCFLSIYDVKPLIENKLNSDLSIKNKWTQKPTSNHMQSGFSGNFSVGFLQMVSYIFVVLRAASDALTAGAVIKYADIIYRFSQLAANIFSALEEYAISSKRQLSTLEYLNVADVLKKRNLPLQGL